MKFALVALFTTLSLASCAHPLETIVDQRHEARIQESSANQPIHRGAADGMGSPMVESANRATLSPVRAAKVQNP